MSGKELQSRIKSVRSTRKVTKAMQMVSAAKMRKAQHAMLSARRYQTEAVKLFARLSATEEEGNETKQPLLQPSPDAKKMCVILISSNKGLVGSLNSNLQAELGRFRRGSDTPVDIVTYGKKGRETSIRNKEHVIADFTKLDVLTDTSDIYPISSLATQLYQSREYKAVYILYNYYHSSLVQKPKLEQLLPLRMNTTESQSTQDQDSAILEPSRNTLINHLLPRILESQVSQAVLENNASEQAARMLMMKNATDAATELIDELTFTYNQLRQSKITTELLEITAGKAALE